MQGRWFKVPVRREQPSRRSPLANLPADYDLVVFSDIQAAYDASRRRGHVQRTDRTWRINDLTEQGAETPADDFNTSQYNPSSWDPTNWNPNLNASGLQPVAWSPVASGRRRMELRRSGLTLRVVSPSAVVAVAVVSVAVVSLGGVAVA